METPFSPRLQSAFERGLALFGFGTVMVFSLVSKGATRIYTWPWVFYCGCLLLAPIFLLGWRFLRQSTSPRNGGGAWLALSAALLLSVVCARHPAFSFEATLPLWAGLAFSWVVAEFVSAPAVNTQLFPALRAIGFFFVLPLAVGLYWWSQDLRSAAGGPGGWPPVLADLVHYRNPHPLGHWNYTGGFALLALPWLGVLAWVERARWRLAWILAGGISLAAFLSAASRGAVLGLLAAIAAAFVLAVSTRGLSRLRLVTAGLAGILVVTGLMLTNSRLRTLALHPASVFNLDDGDVQRLGMLQGGWLLGWRSPWIGHGPGMTPFVYPEVRAQLVGGVETSYQLHNGWLQLWVDAGLVGVLAAIACGGTLLLATLRWLKQPPGTVRLFGLAGACTLFGYAVLALTDFQLNAPPMVAALAIYAGFVLAAPPRPAAQVKVRRVAGGVLVAAVAGALLLLVPSWRSRADFWEVWQAPEEVQLDLLQKVVLSAPGNFNYRNILGLQLGRAAEKKNDPALRQAARRQLSLSLAIDQAQEPVHAALGWLWLYDDPRQSMAHFAAALALLPDRDTLHLGLALACLSLHDEKGAVDALALECIVNPRFLASPLWTQPPLAALKPRVQSTLPSLYEKILQDPALPAWRQSKIHYALAFTRWWETGELPAGDALAGGTRAQKLFFSGLASPSAAQWPGPVSQLAAHLKNPSQQEPFQATAPAQEGAAARLSDSVSSQSLSGLIRAPSPHGEGVVQSWIERAHFQIMQRNLDGPGYADFAPNLVDAFTLEFAAFLFPDPNLIPGKIIQELNQATRSR